MRQWSIRWCSCTFVSRSRFLSFQSTGAQDFLINIHIHSWREGAKRREPNGAWWQDQRQWSQTEMQEVSSEHHETLCQLWEWPNSGKGCPERWWSLHPCKYAKVVWTWSWRTWSKCFFLSMGFGLDDFQRSLKTSALLWFCSFHLQLFLFVTKQSHSNQFLCYISLSNFSH